MTRNSDDADYSREFAGLVLRDPACIIRRAVFSRVVYRLGRLEGKCRRPDRHGISPGSLTLAHVAASGLGLAKYAPPGREPARRRRGRNYSQTGVCPGAL